MRNKTVFKSKLYRIVKQRKRKSDKSKFVVMRRVLIIPETIQWKGWTQLPTTSEPQISNNEMKVATFMSQQEAEHYITMTLLQGKT